MALPLYMLFSARTFKMDSLSSCHSALQTGAGSTTVCRPRYRDSLPSISYRTAVNAQEPLGTFSSMKWRINRVASLQALLRAAILSFPFATRLALFFNPLLPPPTQTWWGKFMGSNSSLLRTEEQKYGLKEGKKKPNQVDFQEGGGIYLLKVHKWFGSQRPQDVNGIQTFKSLMLMKTLHTNSTLGKSAFSFFFFPQQAENLVFWCAEGTGAVLYSHWADRAAWKMDVLFPWEILAFWFVVVFFNLQFAWEPCSHKALMA